MPKNFAVSVSIRAIDEVTKVMNRVTSNISKRQEDIKKVSEAVVPRSVNNALSDFKSEWNGISSSLETKSFFKNLSDGTTQATSGFRSLGSAARDSIKGLAMAGFALGGVSVFSARMFGDISRSNTELKHSAMGLGVSPQTLRSYRLASESMGVPASAIDTAFHRLNQMGFEFRAGNHAAASPIAALPGGVRLLDENSRQRSPEALFTEILDKIGKSGLSQITKTELLNSILGGSDTLPLTYLGSKGFRDQARLFEAGSYEDSDRASRRYMQANAQFKSSLDQLNRTASISILPGIAKGLDRISDWISAHQDQLKKLFKDIGESIPSEMSRALGFLSAFATGLTFISKTVGLANFVFVTLSATILGKVLFGFYRLYKALKVFGVFSMIARGWGLLRVALAVPLGMAGFGSFISGIGIAIALVVGSIYIITKYKKELVHISESIGAFFKNALTGFADWTMALMKPITDWIQSVFSALGLLGRKVEISAPNGDSGQKLDFQRNSTGKSDFLSQIFQSNTKRESSKQKDPSEVRVILENLPKGTRIEEKKGDTPISVSSGYIMAGGFA